MAKPKKPKFGSSPGAWELDSRQFDKMLKELVSKFNPPKSFEDVLTAEALSVLQGAARKTKRSSINKVKARFNPSKESYIPMVRIDGRLVSTRVLKGQSSRDKSTGQFVKPGGSMGARIQKRVDTIKERALNRVGLSRAIFYAIANDSLKLPGGNRNWGADQKYIVKAYETQKEAGKGSGGGGSSKRHKPFNKSWLRSQTGSKGVEGPNGYVIKFTADTGNTFNPFVKGVAAVQSAINGRVGLFKRGVKNDWFNDLKFIEKNYPNFRVTP